MSCTNDRLVMEVKSGEARNFGFTIEQKYGQDLSGNPVYVPMDLTDYTVNFEIKRYPYFSVEPLISKTITTADDEYNGSIYNATDGQFKVNITLADLETLVPSQEYYVIITLLNGDTRIIISGEGNTSGVFRFCKS